MCKARKALLAVGVLAAMLAPAAWTQSKPQQPPPKVKIGDEAPDFTLLAYNGQGVQPVSLRDYRGKKSVVLAFYVFAFTGG